MIKVLGVAQLWGVLAIAILCPLVGGLPLTGWITQLISGQRLRQIGTRNIGVSAAFYHGGTVAGILAVLAEAGKGFFAVYLARAFFPDSTWQLIALMALVIGRYWLGKGAGTTNVVWGCVAYDWSVALLIFILGGISFTLLRERHLGRIGILVLFPLVIALQRQSGTQTLVAIALSSLLYWIYQQMPDDLNLSTTTARRDSQRMFRFFRGDKALLSLDQPLDARKVGQKAATLSQLKRWGYPVPMGWALPAGDDPEPLIESLSPSPDQPLVVRSSAIGEDSESASAAGQYQTILQVTSRLDLLNAIGECQGFYDQPHAMQYRQDRGIREESGMAVLVQQQVQGVFSGVAFSRDPLQGGLDAVAIEALPGAASRVVSGQVNPESYLVIFPQAPTSEAALTIQGESGDLPLALIRQVAWLAREIEARYHGIPQDIEWSFDGQTLWVLQSRPVTTLLPIWTRKIAAEVIPGVIHPLTWSINRPLTCDVWGQLFTLVLGRRARGLDFRQTATLHYARAYFNASLLGEIFRLMGLPAESLEFLTRGAKMGKPSPLSTLRNVPGLLKLVGRELQLETDFQRDLRLRFTPLLAQLRQEPADNLDTIALGKRIQSILTGLEQATYYSILAPLSAALRQAGLKVKDTDLDSSQSPEAASLKALEAIAHSSRERLGNVSLEPENLFQQLAERPGGQDILTQWQDFLDRYGYMSAVATDIAVPTWREAPQPLQTLFSQYLREPPELSTPNRASNQSWSIKAAQRRIDLKGAVSAVYSELLAQLRWSFIALEQLWRQAGVLSETGDIFFLEFSEIMTAIEQPETSAQVQWTTLITARRTQLEQHRQLAAVPSVVYGQPPDNLALNFNQWQPSETLQGIGASPGQVEGWVKVIHNLDAFSGVDRQTILVVPYTDAGWAPLLARAGGLISEVGGRLSHGAIVAREYGIPAVMEVEQATRLFQDGQRVRIDGQRGIIEIL